MIKKTLRLIFDLSRVTFSLTFVILITLFSFYHGNFNDICVSRVKGSTRYVPLRLRYTNHERLSWQCRRRGRDIISVYSQNEGDFCLRTLERLPPSFIRRKHRKKDLASSRFLSSRLWTIIAADADAFRLHLPYHIPVCSLLSPCSSRVFTIFSRATLFSPIARAFSSQRIVPAVKPPFALRRDNPEDMRAEEMG